MQASSTHFNSSTLGEKKQAIEEFYNEFGIKQYSSFSGGFRYHEKPSKPQMMGPAEKDELSRQDLYRQLGLSKKANKLDCYKLENEYVPQTKGELADHLMVKIEHQMKKMKYYRQKYYER